MKKIDLFIIKSIISILLIKVKIEREKERKLREQFIKLNDKINEIQNMHIKNIYENYQIDDDSNIHIAVLTSNPLINVKTNQELKSINDFNMITKSIYETIKDKSIIAKFLPLTINNLKEVINEKPKIIHLVCKSTYIIDDINLEGKFSYNYVNLILEENQYFEMREIRKKDLDNIFKKNLIENTLLIISTQLAEDVYEMMKNYEFKNILIQYTTIANSSYIENFNKKFYHNIFSGVNNSFIYECFDNARKSLDLDYSIKGKKDDQEERQNINYQFCCCRHKHKIDCTLFTNLEHELYIGGKMPHFSHLRYKGENYKKCCCNDICEKKDIFYHNLYEKKNMIKYYSGNNGIFLKKNNFIPNTEIISGRNKIIYDLYCQILN